MAGGLSSRARRLLENPPFPEYLSEHFALSDQAYDTDSRPGGYIGLCVAENLLLTDRLLARMSACPKVPGRVLGYDKWTGSLQFREQLARFLGRRFLGREFKPEQLAVLAGAGSALEILFHNLADAGDGVLIPTPSYAGFWADLKTRDDLTILPVHTTRSEDFRLTPSLLDRAVADAERPPKALLFTSPNNPLGTVYSSREIEEIVRWADDARVHVVFDEIYALSVFGKKPFTSVAEVVPELGDLVHIVWAFSKDFGASGLRCGVLVSENEELLTAMDALAYWACCSGHTQFLLGQVISDDAWVDAYLQENREVLGDAYRQVIAMLGEAGISFVPADAGFFVLCDLRRHLEAPTWDAEHALWKRLLEKANVNLTPGWACQTREPGFLRLCFAGVPTKTVLIGLRRIIDVLGDRGRS